MRHLLGASTCVVVTASCLLVVAGPASADPGEPVTPRPGSVATAPPLAGSPNSSPAPQREPGVGASPAPESAGSAVLSPTPSASTNPSPGTDADAVVVPDTPPATIEEARERVRLLQQQSSAAAERANGLREKLATVQARMDQHATQVSRVRVELASQQRALQAIARQLYVNGGVSGAALSFALDDPERFLEDLDRLIAASDTQSAALARTRANAVLLKSASDGLSREQAELVKATAQLGEQQALAATKLAEAWQTVAAMEEAERQRLAEEFRQAQETARLEAAAARQALSATAPAAGSVQPMAGGSVAPAPQAAATQSAGAIRQVIDFALSKVGGPYVWGASGPDAYDCSGLTQAAWAQVGVKLTHYSGTQYTGTTSVALEAIQPGDLLYFYSIHQHVGLYIGDGKFVHAANSADGIRLDSLSGHYRDNLVAASRPGL